MLGFSSALEMMHNEVESEQRRFSRSPQSRAACGRHGVSLAGGIPRSIATLARDLEQHPSPRRSGYRERSIECTGPLLLLD